jgi:hypothetical protein
MQESKTLRDIIIDELIKIRTLKNIVNKLKTESSIDYLSNAVNTIITHKSDEDNIVIIVAKHEIEIKRLEEHVDILKEARSLGYNSEEEYKYLSKAEIDVEMFKTKQTKFIDGVVYNLNKLHDYNIGAHRRTLKKKYIKRCEEYLKIPQKIEYVDHIIINSDYDFCEMKHAFLSSQRYASEYCDITTKYLEYAEYIILKAHIKHNEYLLGYVPKYHCIPKELLKNMSLDATVARILKHNI